MRFWASSEAYRTASETSERVRKLVEPLLNQKIAASNLALLDCEIRYVPTIMPPELADRYPARSKLRLTKRVYDQAPQLPYETFAHMDLAGQLHAYIDGIRPAAFFLAALGGTSADQRLFEEILDAVLHELTAKNSQSGS